MTGEPSATGLADALVAKLSELESLLDRYGESRWVKAMVTCRQEVERCRHDRLADAGRLILTMFGGMGSLNDVMFYRNRQVLQAETDEFYRLKEQLWVLAKAAIAGSAA